MKSKLYLKLWFSYFLFLCICFASFNWIVDPFGIFGAIQIEGFNTLKPDFSEHLRLGKAAIAARLAPGGVILGSSRAEQAYDTEHPGWNSQVRPRYNLGLSAANMYEILRYFQHTHATRPVRQSVLGLDFFVFNIYRENKPDFSEDRLAVSLAGRRNLWTLRGDFFPVLLSNDAWKASLRTFRVQDPSSIHTPYLPNGQRSWQDKPQRILKKGGHRKAFLANESLFANTLYLPAPRYKYDFVNPETGESNWQYYRRLLSTAYRDEVDLILSINPCHARQLELIASLNLWDEFEMWKRQLVEINEQEARRHDRPPFPIWDFSGYTSLTTEAVPAPEDQTTSMKWYYESSHFSKELGDLVLDRVFDYRETGRDLPGDFGVLLTADNIEEHLAKIRRNRQRYRETHGEDVKEIETIAAEAERRRPDSHADKNAE
ncbi:hypothetical protein [Lyngbya sp. CCY1209]|uniref:hypothetical protein n=1 Tax=Lyngbya sp. CCY1209 TaxID=2886103 RepID=UPI002D208377|nr:hypothetical protein [Lyngbya sp. CCY1209]MEB3884628.1 hypothetical protein [Lyngbya sp. CCY1209]